jgi:hypothetical protein
MKPETIRIDDVEYVRADSAPKINTDNYCIVRSAQAGVFAGNVVDQDFAEGWVKMANAHRLWFWSGAASLSQLALEGVKKSNDCKFTVTVPEQTILGVCEILPCTTDAVKSIAGVKVWKM